MRSWLPSSRIHGTFRPNVSFEMRLRTESVLPEFAKRAPFTRGNGVKHCTTRSHIHTRRGQGSLGLSLGVPFCPTGIPLVGLGGTCAFLVDHHRELISLSDQMCRLRRACAQNLTSRNSPNSPNSTHSLVGDGVKDCTTRPHIHMRQGQGSLGLSLGSLSVQLEPLWSALGIPVHSWWTIIEN